MPPAKVRRVAVVGFRSVGKSSLTVQYVEGHFVDSYFPTIENAFTKSIKYRGQEYTAEIIDTAGQDEYSILSSNHALGIHGYVLVYSITSRASFDMVSVIRDKILNYTGANWVPCVLVGNKSDLQMQRQVTKHELEKQAQQWNCAFVESSAKQNDNINEVFELLVAEIEKSANPEDPPKGKNCIVQ